MHIQAALGVLKLVEAVWGARLTQDMMKLFGTLGTDYTPEQFAKLDAEYVEGLERRRDAEERANRPL